MMILRREILKQPFLWTPTTLPYGFMIDFLMLKIHFLHYVLRWDTQITKSR